MKFLAVLALINVSQAAECLVDATDNGDGTGVNADASDCEVPECVDPATENASGGPCTVASSAPPACSADAICNEDGSACLEADDTVCTGPVPEPEEDGPPECSADAFQEDDERARWVEPGPDGEAGDDCQPTDEQVAAAEGGDALAAAACESADDCEGDDMVCATTSLGEVDQEHETWTQEAEDVATAFLPIKACATLAECETYQTEQMDAADAGEAFYTMEVSCGATKLIASFAALALASAGVEAAAVRTGPHLFQGDQIAWEGRELQGQDPQGGAGGQGGVLSYPPGRQRDLLRVSGMM